MIFTFSLDEVTAAYVSNSGNIKDTFVMPPTTSTNKRVAAAIEHFADMGYDAARENILVMGVRSCSAKYQAELTDVLEIAERTD